MQVEKPDTLFPGKTEGMQWNISIATIEDLMCTSHASCNEWIIKILGENCLQCISIKMIT